MSTRIAICLSGQPRTWDKCYPSWVKFFEQLKSQFSVDQIDLFCHVWDFNASPHAVLANGTTITKDMAPDYLTVEGTKISDQEKQNFIDTLNPTRYKFEDEWISKYKTKEVFYKNKPFLDYYGKPVIDWAGSQFYSVMHSAHLKKQFELQNNFRYDMCIRMRYDLFIDDNTLDCLINYDIKFPVNNTFYSCHTGKDTSQFPFHRLGDIFWYADSITFDRICDFYRYIPMLGSKNFNGTSPGTEHVLYFYAKSLRMEVEPLLCDPKIYRETDYLIKKQQLGLPGELGGHEVI